MEGEVLMSEIIRKKEDEYLNWVRWREQMEQKIQRIISERENEKGTSEKVSAKLEEKLDNIFARLNKQDKLLYMIFGGIIVANSIVVFMIELFKK